MSVRLHDVLAGQLGELRHEPTAKRIRASVGGAVVLDSTHAVLVWEPRRVVPTYAVPVADVHAEIEDDAPAPEGAHPPGPLDPRVPFGVHTTPGRPVLIRPAGSGRPVRAFRPDDPDLAGHVVVDFAGPDTWLEEDEAILSHPRDPFHRVDVRDSTRHVQVLLDGQLLADTRRSRMVFETSLPVRHYLPPDDVLVDLEPSDTRTACAYKGVASYRSVVVGDRRLDDLVWCYEHPLEDAAALKGYVAFYDEKVDVVVDGAHRGRPVTAWS